MKARTGHAVLKGTHDVVRVEVTRRHGSHPKVPGNSVLPVAETPRASVVLVGGHEGGAGAAVKPSDERGPLLRAASAREVQQAVRHALESSDLPVCVVPMTLGRDPGLVADTARTLMMVPRRAAAGRLVLADAFGTPTLLTGWLRVAAAQAADSLDATERAVVLIANAANKYDDAELFRIAHLVRVQAALPWVEVAFRSGDPDLAEAIDRCQKFGARRTTVIPADFHSATATGAEGPGVVTGEPLLSPATVSGVLATRTAAALLKLGRGDDGIAAALER